MTIQEIQEEIIGEFNVFDGWVEKYSRLIALSKKLPCMEARHKTESNLIRGCQFKVWFYSFRKDGKIFYDIDSVSDITRGIIFLLKRILSGQNPKDIQGANLYFIDKIGLREHFSPMRANGLWKIEKRMMEDAVFYQKNIN